MHFKTNGTHIQAHSLVLDNYAHLSGHEREKLNGSEWFNDGSLECMYSNMAYCQICKIGYYMELTANLGTHSKFHRNVNKLSLVDFICHLML